MEWRQEAAAAAAAAAVVQFREGAFRLHAPRQRERQGQSSQSPPRRRLSKGRGKRTYENGWLLPLLPPRPSKVGANARLNLV